MTLRQVCAWLGVLAAVGSFCAVPVSGQSACDESIGRIERRTYPVVSLAGEMFYTVYLPPCYESSGETYPVLYLLHGSNEDDSHWLRLGLVDALDAGIRNGDFPPIVVVLPFGDWIANENRFERASWGNIFLNDLMPHVEDAYRVGGSAAQRAIGGISRGGFWAFQIAFRNPALFSAVGGHSPFFDLYHAPPEDNPLNLAMDAPGIDSLRVMLDRAPNDLAWENVDLMRRRLESRGLSPAYILHPAGQHDNASWMPHVNTYLQFYTSAWGTPVIEMPQTTGEALSEGEEGVALFLPVIAFPSTQVTTSAEHLRAVRAGLLDPALVLSENTAAALESFGMVLAPGTTVVPENDLYYVLWRHHDKFTLMPFDQITPRYRVLWVDEQHPLDMDLAEYPFAFSSSTPNFDPQKLMRFLLSGVTALTRNTRVALDENGAAWAAEAIQPYVSRADFFHMSNEVSLYPTCPETDGPMFSGSVMSFCSKEAHFEVLLSLGVDIVELSGNHNNDYGYDAYLDTLAWYGDKGIATVGGGATLEQARTPLIITYNGNQVALLSCNWAGPYFALVNEDPAMRGGVRPGAAFCDFTWLSEIVPRLAARNDVVIVTVQYLEFDQHTPTDRQQSDFRWLVGLGADVVLGTQAHYPQTFEFVTRDDKSEALVHYGLGNLFFDQQFFAGVRFLMDQLFIYEGRLVAVDLFPGLIEGQGRPRPMTPQERENFLYIILKQYGNW